jgi:hypothetical protein
MNSDTLWQVATGAVIIAIVYMLVRPGSPGAKAVADISGALASMIKTATGYQAGSSNG